MKEKIIIVDAVTDRLSTIFQFVEEELDAYCCPADFMLQLQLAVEEIFVNIAYYAYTGTEKPGKVRVTLSVWEPEREIMLCFQDTGTAFNPLKAESPDLNADVKQRQIGGLGIVLTRKMCDELSYQRERKENRLTLKKHW